MHDLELISNTLCPYTQRVAIQLAEKGLEARRTYIDLAAKPDWFVQLSPQGKVPVLRVGDTAVFETSVICEYIEETAADRTPLWPTQALDRARHRAWAEFASAVIADLVDITRLATADPDHRVPSLAFQPDALADTPILPIGQVQTSFYLRLRVADEAGVLAEITGILADNGISIDAVLQRESAEGEKQTDLIILTHETQEGRLRAAEAKMQALPSVLAPIVSLRKEELA